MRTTPTRLHWANISPAVGGGIIINGKIYSGSNYAGAELGHMVIVKDGKECACGRKGCWETYASATGLINMTKQKILSEKLDYSYMLKLCDGDINKVNGKTAFDAMEDGDPAAKEVVEEYVAYLATGLVNIINIFQPDVLCVGGGVSNQGENLLGPVRAFVERERMQVSSAPLISIDQKIRKPYNKGTCRVDTFPCLRIK